MNAKTQIISTEDGRNLRILEAGSLEGIPILVHHGTPDSMLLYSRWIDDARSRRIRLIGYDRPGYGGSTPNPGRTVASAAKDVATIAKKLGIKKLFIWGSSGGGPHALACAALLPDLVVAAAVLCSMAPFDADGLDFFAGIGESDIAEYHAALEGRAVLQQLVEEKAPSLLSGDPKPVVEAFRSILSPKDAAIFSDEFGYFVLNRVREGSHECLDGWIDDDIAFTMPWGFELSRIQIPVLLMQGGQDQMVPRSHWDWLARHIPGVDARFFPDDSHFTLSANRIPEVHSWLLNKME